MSSVWLVIRMNEGGKFELDAVCSSREAAWALVRDARTSMVEMELDKDYRDICTFNVFSWLHPQGRMTGHDGVVENGAEEEAG